MSGVTHKEVLPGEAGWRFDKWARTHFPELPFGKLQKLLRTGQFRIDGRRAQSSSRLEAGQSVRVPPLTDQEAAKPVAARRFTIDPRDARMIRECVIYEDEHLIALDKPSGLAVQGGSGTRRHVDGFLDVFTRRGERPRLVHRLDRDTSGLLIVARTAAFAKEIGFALQQHKVRKLYWALWLKGPERNSGEIKLALAKGGAPGAERMQGRTEDDEDARDARSRFMVLARAGRVASWAALMPLTGRTHQLRVHSAMIGCPILGDGKYGGRSAHLEGLPKGLMLHARELDLPHPQKGRLRLVAGLPAHFREGLAHLGLESPVWPGQSLDDWPADAD